MNVPWTRCDKHSQFMVQVCFTRALHWKRKDFWSEFFPSLELGLLDVFPWDKSL